MATNFPTNLDSYTNPLSTDLLTSPAHHTQHANANDAIVALETKVGKDGSATTTTHDYKLSGVTGTDKAASKTGAETLTNKTLTAPNINMGSDATGDMYYRNGSGVLTRLAIGSTGQILNTDASGIPAWIANPSAADASTVPVKGVVVLGTQAKVDSADDTNTTSAKNVVTPSTLRARLLNTGVADTGSANAIAIAPSPAITAYAAYQEFTFKAAATNTGATTINVNSLGTKNIFYNGAALVGGEIVSGVIYTVVYDGTQFNLTSPPSKLGNKVYFGTADVSINVANTNENTLFSTSLPGNSLGTGGGIKIRMHISGLSTDNGSPSTITFRIKFGSMTLAFPAITPASSAVTTDSGFIEAIISNNAATNVQYGSALLYKERIASTNAGTAYIRQVSGTGAVDTTSSVTISLTTQWSGTTGNTGTIAGITVEKIS